MGAINFASSSETREYSYPKLVYTFLVERDSDLEQEFYGFAKKFENNYDFLDIAVEGGYYEGVQVNVQPCDKVLNFAYSDIENYECYKLIKELKDIHKKMSEYGVVPTSSSWRGTSEISQEFYDEIVRDFIKEFDEFRTEYIKDYIKFLQEK